MEIKGKDVEIEVTSPNDVELEVNDSLTIRLKETLWGEIVGDINNQSDLIEKFEKEENARKSLAKSLEYDTSAHRKVFEVIEPEDVIFTFEHNLSTKDLLINVYSIYGVDLHPSIKREYNSITLEFNEVPQSFRVVVLAINKWTLSQLSTDLPMF